MLVNGKEVGYLILSGETFESKHAFPAYYKFVRGTGDSMSRINYYFLELDNNKQIIFTPAKSYANDYYLRCTFNNNKTLVTSIITWKGDDYALIWGISIDPRHDDSQAYSQCQGYIWIKMSDYGGGKRL